MGSNQSVNSIVAMALLVATVACGCKSESAPHPGQERAKEFLDALKYRDLQGAASRHIDSTSEGFYCGSEKFERALQRARDAKSDAECERVQKLGEAQLSELEQEARLIVQMVRFACEQPEADCAGYGQRVLESHLAQLTREGSESRWAIGDYRIQRVLGGDEQAVVYVDLFSTSGDEPAEHATIGVRKVADEWFVTESLHDESAAQPRLD